jgi:hypothetical protein
MSIHTHSAALPTAAVALTVLLAANALAADADAVGAWRATDDCFLSAFNLNPAGRAETRYLTGERDYNAEWQLDDGTLTITSAAFPMDSFEGEIAGDKIAADFAWHDLDLDRMNPQNCTFERFRPVGA